jgi:sec-independent protein translocase protein TatA
MCREWRRPLDIGPVEIVLVLAVVLLLFGGTRIAEVGGSLGRGIREFRNAIREDEDAEEDASGSKEAPEAAPELVCASCGTMNVPSARYCSDCGSALSA